MLGLKSIHVSKRGPMKQSGPWSGVWSPDAYVFTLVVANPGISKFRIFSSTWTWRPKKERNNDINQVVLYLKSKFGAPSLRGDELLCLHGHDWYTRRPTQTQTMTIPGCQNWPRVQIRSSHETPISYSLPPLLNVALLHFIIFTQKYAIEFRWILQLGVERQNLDYQFTVQ